MENEILDVLAHIQMCIQVPKNKSAVISNRSFAYRSAEDILETVRKIIKELDKKCIVVCDDEIVLVGNRYYVKATARIIIGRKQIKSVGYAREADEFKGMSVGQLTGATSSYARKYALCGLFAISDGNDLDSAGDGKPTQSKKPENVVIEKKKEVLSMQNTALINIIISAISKGKRTIEDVKKAYILTEEIENHIKTKIHENNSI
jgi:hypothetical protein